MATLGEVAKIKCECHICGDTENVKVEEYTSLLDGEKHVWFVCVDENAYQDRFDPFHDSCPCCGADRHDGEC